MATNPRIPPDQQPASEAGQPHLVRGGAPQKGPGAGFPRGLLLALVVAAALLAAILYFMPRGPKNRPVPRGVQGAEQPVANQLQFSHLAVSTAPTGGAVTLRGQVMNTGSRPVLGATVQLRFFNNSGTVIQSIRAPLAGMAVRGNTMAPEAFATDPLKQNASRSFTVTAQGVPAAWNHQMPEMKVMAVSTEGNK